MMTIRIAVAVWALVACAAPALLAQGAGTPAPPPPTGDAKRGQELFDKTYKCYACHGYDGQTGNPRLVPMNRTQEAFGAYVRKPTTAEVPKFVEPQLCKTLERMVSPMHGRLHQAHKVLIEIGIP